MNLALNDQQNLTVKNTFKSRGTVDYYNGQGTYLTVRDSR
jgi:hypothetical protein